MATWYVASTTASPAGSDSNAGTIGAPFATISKAHTSAASGDTVICKASTGTIVWASQTFTKNLTIQGDSVPVYNPITKAWTGAIFDAGNLLVTWSGSVAITLSKLIFRNELGSGTFYDNAVFSFDTFTFERNVFCDIKWISWNSASNCNLIAFVTNRTIVIKNSVFYGQKAGSDSGAALMSCWVAGGSGSVLIQNCILYGNLLCLVSANKSIPLTAKNNVFVNTGSSLPLISQSGSTVYENNCAYGSWSGIPSGSNNITSNPLLIDPANGNVNFQVGSPSVNAGVAL